MYTWACYLKFSVFPAQENKPTVTGMSAVEVFVIKTLRQINAQKKRFFRQLLLLRSFEKSPCLYTERYFQKCPLSITFYVKKYCNRDLDILGKEEAPLYKVRQSSKVWEQVVLSCGVGWGR